MLEQRSIRYGVLALVAAMVVGLFWAGAVRYKAEQRTAAAASAGADQARLSQPGDGTAKGAPAAAAPEQPAAKQEQPVARQEMAVHVAGAVATPGVYRLAQGARVADALAAAGGATAEAAADVLNLAAPVADGDKVYVFTRQEAGAQGCTPAAAAGATHSPVAAASGNEAKPTAVKPGKVNINTASAAQLDALSGITPSVAQAIVEYRTSHGPIQRLEELDAVKGIGPSTIEKLRSQVTY